MRSGTGLAGVGGCVSELEQEEGEYYTDGLWLKERTWRGRWVEDEGLHLHSMVVKASTEGKERKRQEFGAEDVQVCNITIAS